MSEQTKAPQERGLIPVGDRQTLQSLLEQSKEKFAALGTRYLHPERLMRLALVASSRNPELFKCTRASILKACMDANMLGLDCSGQLGQGWLVPYRNKRLGGRLEAQFMPGYRGFISLAKRCGVVKRIESRLVYKGDTFTVYEGTKPEIQHERTFETTGPDNVIAAYAIAWLPDDSTQFDVMDRAQLDAVRERSRAKDSGPWVTDTEEMYRKTVVRRLIKYIPIDPEAGEPIAQALALDNEAEGAIDVDFVDLPEEELPEVKEVTENAQRAPTGKEQRSRLSTADSTPAEGVRAPGTAHSAGGKPGQKPAPSSRDQLLDQCRAAYGRLSREKRAIADKGVGDFEARDLPESQLAEVLAYLEGL